MTPTCFNCGSTEIDTDRGWLKRPGTNELSSDREVWWLCVPCLDAKPSIAWDDDGPVYVTPLTLHERLRQLEATLA